jgi:hypothetical protein
MAQLSIYKKEIVKMAKRCLIHQKPHYIHEDFISSVITTA